MQRIQAIETSTAPAESQAMLGAVQKKLGNHIAATVVDFPLVSTANATLQRSLSTPLSFGL